MKRILHGATLGMIGILALSPDFAAAQTPCLEGRTGGGDCVNPQLAETARRSAVIFAQPKLSYTAFPVLPTNDNLYRYPNQLLPDPLKATPLGPFILGPGGKVILVH
jgi:hypothetical protein